MQNKHIRQQTVICADEELAELIDFLHEQATEFDEFDDGLVRRLIEQITVHENGTFTVEFKSGTMVEV